MFGDEPYGNYNRIMLSGVLAGDDADEIFLNPLEWYLENDVTLYAGIRVVRIDRFARRVFADDGTILPYDKLVIATGSRTFFPPMDGMWVDDRTLTPGSCSASARSTTPPRCWSTHRSTAPPSSSAGACSGWRRRTGCSSMGWRSTSCSPGRC
jgi:NAD(P)H-nitrite reductase